MCDVSTFDWIMLLCIMWQDLIGLREYTQLTVLKGVNVVLQVSLSIYAESERSLHVTLCWNIINITKCLLPLEFVVWNCRPALQYYRMIKMVSI